MRGMFIAGTLSLTLLTGTARAARQPPTDAPETSGSQEIRELLDRFKVSDAEGRHEILGRLHAMGPGAFDALFFYGKRDVENKLITGGDPAIWNAAVAALAMMGESAVERAVVCVETANPFSRYWLFGARVLEASSAVTMATVDRLYRHSHEKVREEAITILGRLRSPEALERLMRVARSGPAVERMIAGDALLRSGTVEALPIWKECVRDPNRRMRELAVLGLARDNMPESRLEIARAARSDPDEGVRDTASQALKDKGGALGKRLWQRYYAALSTPDPRPHQLHLAFRVWLSGFLFLLMGFGVRGRHADRPLRLKAWLLLAGLAALGGYWGYFAKDVFADTEHLLLGSWLFLTTFFGWLTRRDGLWAWGVVLACAFGGYAVGQTILWGGSPQWVLLWFPFSLGW